MINIVAEMNNRRIEKRQELNGYSLMTQVITVGGSDFMCVDLELANTKWMIAARGKNLSVKHFAGNRIHDRVFNLFPCELQEADSTVIAVDGDVIGFRFGPPMSPKTLNEFWIKLD